MKRKQNLRRAGMEISRVVLGWALLALGCIAILSWWTIRSVIPDQMPAEEGTSNPESSFEFNVREGNICKGPLAVAHNFSVSLTNADKTGFIMLDEQKNIGELRSFAWPPMGNNWQSLGIRQEWVICIF